MPENRNARADALLHAVSHGDTPLKVFLGAAPGVGKTFAMLSAAQELKRQGVDVVVGVVETHGRAETDALLQGLEVLPRRQLEYQGRNLQEFDLDAALERHPAVLLVDELAHRNAPGSRHKRRWQDVAELLEAGIEVYTALNVQHLESLNDQVRRITGVPVRETVPDAFLDRARDIVLVDLPPRELITRLKQGKVYLPEVAGQALSGFFSPTNLGALRELAVETIAAHVDSDLRETMLASGGSTPVRRRVMAAIDGFGQSEYLVRVARRIADRRGARWSVVFVNTGRELDPERRERIDAVMRLATHLGGESVVLRGQSVVDELLACAEREGVGQILIGRTRERPLAQLFGRALTQQLLRKGAHLELTIIATPAQRKQSRLRLRMPEQGSRREYMLATMATLLAFAVAFLAERYLSVANLGMIFLIAVLAVAARTRMTVAVYTALLCFLGYNFLFTQPRFTFEIASADDVLAVVLFMITALISSRLATRLAEQVTGLRIANAHTRALLALGQRISESTDTEGVQRVGVAGLASALDCDAAILEGDHAQGFLVAAAEPHDFSIDVHNRAAAEWCERHAEPAGRFTDTLNSADSWLLPLGTSARMHGVVALRFPPGVTDPGTERRRLALAMTQDIGRALERARLTSELEGARLQGETERLRNALLSSVSHDLRSPLASMIGSAGTLKNFWDKLPESERGELLQAILGEGQRLDRYIQNLLDMTRLGHGTLQLTREWIEFDVVAASALARLHKMFPDTPIIRDFAHPVPIIHVHPALIEQALFNILENAARFTPEGAAVTLASRVVDNALQIDVTDRGPGIPEQERRRIFDMFYSVERGDRGQQGTGLGLAICRGMIGAHGGQVEALPGRHGIGTCVRITLPLTAKSPESGA